MSDEPAIETKRISFIVSGWVDDAIALSSMGDEIWWDMAPMVFNTPAGQQPTFMFFFYMRSPMLGVGNTITSSILAGQPLILMSKENVDALVRDGVAQLVEMRSKILSGSNGHN